MKSMALSAVGECLLSSVWEDHGLNPGCIADILEKECCTFSARHHVQQASHRKRLS